MLHEAVALIRSLWEGARRRSSWPSYTVENARIYDIPERPVPIVVSAFGTSAAELAAEIGDGIWMTGPNPDVLTAFEKAGGSGPRIGQLTLCWAPDKDQALATVRRIWPNTALPGQLAQDLPTPSHFEQASALVTPDLLAEQVTAGPDPEPVLDAMPWIRRGGHRPRPPSPGRPRPGRVLPVLGARAASEPLTPASRWSGTPGDCVRRGTDDAVGPSPSAEGLRIAVERPCAVRLRRDAQRSELGRDVLAADHRQGSSCVLAVERRRAGEAASGGIGRVVEPEAEVEGVDGA